MRREPTPRPLTASRLFPIAAATAILAVVLISARPSKSINRPAFRGANLPLPWGATAWCTSPYQRGVTP